MEPDPGSRYPAAVPITFSGFITAFDGLRPVSGKTYVASDAQASTSNHFLKYLIEEPLLQ